MHFVKEWRILKDDLPQEDRRNIVQPLIYIEIAEDNIIIHWKFCVLNPNLLFKIRHTRLSGRPTTLE